MDFSGMKVLVIGDICLDVIQEGKAERLSPEAPVPVIVNPDYIHTLGMAGNVALNISNLGAEVDLLSLYGNDPYGKIIDTALYPTSIKRVVDDFNVKSKVATICKMRIVANGQQVTRIDFEDDKSYYEQLSIELLKDIDFNKAYDLIIVSDYDKGFITKDTWNIICNKLIKSNKGNFFVDTKKKNVVDFYEGMIIFPNTKEINAMMEYEEAYTPSQLREKLESYLLVETASEKGAYGYSDTNLYHSKTFIKEVIDVTGAGDTFIAAFALYYTKFGNTPRSLDFANFCCGKVVSKKGTVPITYEEAAQYDYQNK